MGKPTTTTATRTHISDSRKRLTHISPLSEQNITKYNLHCMSKHLGSQNMCRYYLACVSSRKGVDFPYEVKWVRQVGVSSKYKYGPWNQIKYMGFVVICTWYCACELLRICTLGNFNLFVILSFWFYALRVRRFTIKQNRSWRWIKFWTFS